MTIRAIGGYAATALLSCAAGWLMNAAEPAPASAPAPLTAPRAAPATAVPVQLYSDPLIAVASDGNVTLRVEQQPLEWVLEEIAKQSGWVDVKQRARSTRGAGTDAAPGSAVCAEARLVTPVRATQLLQ